MGEDIPMFRAGLVLVAVIAVAGLSYSLVSGEAIDWRWENGSPPAAEARVAMAEEGAGAPDPKCRVVQRPLPVRAPIAEASGIAVSLRTPDVLWTHNDSGEPLLYAMDAAGAALGQVRVTGAEVEDWEDVAAAPCPAGNCLYVADIGDNRGKRKSITVYRVAEPAPGDAQTRPADALRARYPDEAQDAEALLVTPAGRIYVLTKGENGPVTLYRYPEGAGVGEVATLERVRALTDDKVEREARVTGGAVSRDGRWAAVRTVRAVSLQPLGDLVAGRKETLRHVDLTSLAEPQGEGVAFEGEGGVVLSSEAGAAMGPSMLSRLRCAL